MLPSTTNFSEQQIIHNSNSYNYPTKEPTLKKNKKAFDIIREPNFSLVSFTISNLTFNADYNRVVVSATNVHEFAPTKYLAKLATPKNCTENCYVLKNEEYVKSFEKFKRAAYVYTLAPSKFESGIDPKDIETDSEDTEDETVYLHPGKMIVKKGPSTMYEAEFFQDGTSYADVFNKNYEIANYCVLLKEKSPDL